MPPNDSSLHAACQLASRESETAPSAISLTGNFERVVIVRLKYDTDLLEGLEDAVGKQGIKNAVVPQRDRLRHRRSSPRAHRPDRSRARLLRRVDDKTYR